MDHLPTPEGADTLQIRVPYCGGTYDDGPFMTYLDRQKTDIHEFLFLAELVLRPHKVSVLERELWLDVEFERLIEVCTLANSNPDTDTDATVAKLASLLVSAEGKRQDPKVCSLPEGQTSVHQSTVSQIVEKITICEVLRGLYTDAQSKDRQGDMIAAEVSISWYRRVVHLARTAFGSDSKRLLDQGQGHELLLALRQCSKPMPASLLYTQEVSTRVRKLYTVLQNWLFFGILHDTFRQIGIEFQAKDFLEDCEDEVWLSTKRLPEYIDAWKTKEAADIEGKQVRGREITANLQWASKVAAQFERVVPSRGIGDSALTCCILLLVYTLQQQASVIYGRGFVLSFTSAHLRRRFLASGWCPNQVAAIEASFVLPWQYYIYLTSHHRLDDQKEDLHHRCTISECRVNQVSTETYRPKHVFNDQGIEFGSDCVICHIANGYRKSAPRKDYFDPNMKELVQIVEEGDIPLISIYNANIEQYNNDPKIVRYDPTRMTYVTISHVWADGLGNPYSNSIHLCQILMLAKSLTQLGAEGTNDGRLYFWLDTICVPLKPDSARIKAIQSISRVFAQAKGTLVMTDDLRRRDVPSTKLETVTRILVSNWTRRLWTYSEAMLSNRIAFKYVGEWVDFHQTQQELEIEATQNPTWDFLGALNGVRGSIRVPWSCSDTIADVLKDLPMITSVPTIDVPQCLAKVKSLAIAMKPNRITPEHTRALAFMSLVRGTPWKATSVAFDELICIAQLLKMDLTPIIQLSPNQTEALKLILQFQHAFPKSIIFVDASHMREDGFRWSPSCFISNFVDQRAVENMKVTRDLALLSTHGLVFEWPGIIFEITQPLNLQDSQNPYFFTFPAGVDITQVKHAYRMLVQSRKEIPHDTLEKNQKHMAIIIEAPAGLPLYEQTVASAVLVTLLRRIAEVCYVRFVVRVTIERLELGALEHPMWNVNLESERHQILDHVEILPPAQAWCLS